MTHNIDLPIMEAMLERKQNYAICFDDVRIFKAWLRDNFDYMQDAGCLYNQSDAYISYRLTKLWIIVGNSTSAIVNRIRSCKFDKIFWKTINYSIDRKTIEGITLKMLPKNTGE